MTVDDENGKSVLAPPRAAQRVELIAPDDYAPVHPLAQSSQPSVADLTGLVRSVNPSGIETPEGADPPTVMELVKTILPDFSRS